MLGGVSLTVMKGTVPYFQGIYVVLGSLKEFYPWLMLDNAKNMINRQLQGDGDRSVLGLHHHRGSVHLVS